MLAMTVDSAKHIAIAIVIGFVVLSLVAATAIKNVTLKLISVLLFIGLALGVWTQRTALQDCAQRVKDKADVGDLSATTCTFFGAEVDVPEVSIP